MDTLARTHFTADVAVSLAFGTLIPISWFRKRQLEVFNKPPPS